MTPRANMTMAALTALIALGGGAASAKVADPAAQFSEIDTNNDGQLTPDEMQAHAQARFAKVDTNGDGFLDAEEMKAAGEARAQMRSDKMAEAAPERAAMMLEQFDADKDGSLNSDELTAMAKEHMGKGRMGKGHMGMGHMGKDHEGKNHEGKGDDANGRDGKGNKGDRHGKMMGKMMERMDADKDGKLSMDEMQARHDPAKMLERLDTDKNGSLSAEEFAKAHEGGKRGHGKPAKK
ncbi:EF hand [Sulfitobacter brevis]|uniref:EF hand n=1 Tax=Sulfitobacter brevis TaxID=74348 RepID=A0A1I1SN04_9RHOB|nr:EF-hand domain-containing protein [Sulfitobacter brevis]SFD47837.1 EF hand [Sulfitobacter brevis]